MAALFVLTAAVASTLWPVWTYALTLALFGLPHVAVELRYLDGRFGARLDERTFWRLGLVLFGIAGVRAAALVPFGTPEWRSAAEILLGGVLLLTLQGALRRRGGVALWFGIGLIGLAGLAAGLAPLATLVGFAVLHNATPVLLFAERLRGSARRTALVGSAVAFLVMPALLLIGGAEVLWTWLGVPASGVGPSAVGGLTVHRGVYVPACLFDSVWQERLFCVAVFLQCLHYAAVLVVLPRLGVGPVADGARLWWPASPRFALAAATVALAVGFAGSFGDARALYGVFASVHAWVEVPLLVLALAAPAVEAASVPPVAA
jgi:hypothetical protein